MTRIVTLLAGLLFIAAGATLMWYRANVHANAVEGETALLRRDLVAARATIAALHEENEGLRNRASSDSAPAPLGDAAASAALPDDASIAEPGGEVTPAPVAVSSADVTGAIASVSNLVALDAAESAALRDRLAAAREGDRVSELLSDVVGEERARRYLIERAEFRRAIRRDASEREALQLSRKLGLTPAQENQVAELILSSRNEYLPIMDDDPVDDALGGSNIEATRARLKREAERLAYVRERLQAVLDEEQYNQYLQDEASSPANRAHQSYVDVSETPAAASGS